MYTLAGIAVSSGIGVAPGLVLTGTADSADLLTATGSADPQAEIDRFQQKSRRFAERLHDLSTPAVDGDPDLYGAVAGFIIHEDNTERIVAAIKRGDDAVMACRTVYLQDLQRFAASAVGGTAADLKEVRLLVQEFIASLRQVDLSALNMPTLTAPTVIIARDLTPAMFLSLATERVRGVVLEGGRSSGHLATVMRELGIPAVFEVRNACSVRARTPVLVDADNGVITVEPTADATASAVSGKAGDRFTDDNDDVSLLNITVACSLGTLRTDSHRRNAGKYGIGLLRSEFSFLSSDHEPTAAELTATFRDLFAPVPPNAPITARTFDFADDKKPRFTCSTDTQGPLQGYGAVVGTRLLDKEITALLTAAPQHAVRLVFPLVTRLSESTYLNALAAACAARLDGAGERRSPYSTALMIETPAAVLSARAFAEQCSMFIIGTSSLAEYAAAPRPADATFTPALAKMIVMAAQAAHEAGLPVGIAGRFAADSRLLPFFYKLGATYLTVDNHQLTRLKATVEHLSLTGQSPQFDPRLADAVMRLSAGKDLSLLLDSL